jgi:hypothetical protein
LVGNQALQSNQKGSKQQANGFFTARLQTINPQGRDNQNQNESVNNSSFSPRRQQNPLFQTQQSSQMPNISSQKQPSRVNSGSRDQLNSASEIQQSKKPLSPTADVNNPLTPP